MKHREKANKRYRSAKSGEFVSKDEAAGNPDTTVSETVKTPEPDREETDHCDDETE